MLLNRVQTQLLALKEQRLQRFRRTVDQADGVQMVVDGHPMLAFCSNDYLGLANDAGLAQALCEGVQRYGVGAGASHLISGHSRAHALLEAQLATLLSANIPSAQALFFSTGYMANLGLLGGLAILAPDTEIFSEALNHASLIDGMRMARTRVRVFPHRDMASLEQLLAASTSSNKVVVTDSVFSMDGSVADVPALLDLCRRYEAWLVVDDAHGFGVLGASGLGVLEHFGLHDERLLYMGTLGKAAGVSGAFVCAHEDVVSWLVQRSRPYIYTTAAAPALAHALLRSLALIVEQEGQQRRAQLKQNISHLQQSLLQRHWRLMPSETAIQPLLVGDNGQALALSARLFEQGLWVPAIRPPTVPDGTARLRIALSAAHTPAQISRLAEAINFLEAQMPRS
ncbi:8-amino-7-oxononanoate synthase [Pusillimonas sp. CC-YST705]|uniref:8-amino-7-oxononanoate synthase n=2 Tax=Mesopusillimonas faecipullorum TaxID=2755040 RepID=A0ABS8CEH3_9BURK|nr:8-amino-7-oxononanoate synthase [Mesopusillimonas faecipullorum]